MTHVEIQVMGSAKSQHGSEYRDQPVTISTTLQDGCMVYFESESGAGVGMSLYELMLIIDRFKHGNQR